MATQDNAPPSKVLHLRNVSAEVTQSDIEQYCSAFGGVLQVVVMRAKNQALVQMIDLDSARKVVLSTHPQGYFMLRGRKIYARFSMHQELSNMNSPNRILLVTLHNPMYDLQAVMPVTADFVHHIFAPYGSVQKIVVITKPATGKTTIGAQALVQFGNVESAYHAKQLLQGQTLYTANGAISFTLDIQFSNLPELKVHQNSDKTRDYLQDLPAAAAMQAAYQQYDPNMLAAAAAGGAALGYGVDPAAAARGGHPYSAAIAAGAAAAGYGAPTGVGPVHAQYNHHYQQHASMPYHNPAYYQRYHNDANAPPATAAEVAALMQPTAVLEQAAAAGMDSAYLYAQQMHDPALLAQQQQHMAGQYSQQSQQPQEQTNQPPQDTQQPSTTTAETASASTEQPQAEAAKQETSQESSTETSQPQEEKKEDEKKEQESTGGEQSAAESSTTTETKPEKDSNPNEEATTTTSTTASSEAKSEEPVKEATEEQTTTQSADAAAQQKDQPSE